VGKGRRDTVTPVNCSHRLNWNGCSARTVCDHVNVVAGQQNDVSSNKPSVILLTGEMNDALSLKHRMERGQTIARELERPGGSQVANTKSPAVETQGIQYLSDQLRFR
jgi:hypothetical protein